MSCCGKKRSNVAGPSHVGPAIAPRSRFAANTMGALARVQFEYRGGGVLTVIGQATGMEYRFVGYGNRASVDSRDRASLAAVPQLREV